MRKIKYMFGDQIKMVKLTYLHPEEKIMLSKLKNYQSLRWNHSNVERNFQLVLRIIMKINKELNNNFINIIAKNK